MKVSSLWKPVDKELFCVFVSTAFDSPIHKKAFLFYPDFSWCYHMSEGLLYPSPYES